MTARKPNAIKKKIGSYAKSTDVQAKILKPISRIPPPFFPLNSSQLEYFTVACQWLIDNDSLKGLFIPQITRYAVTLNAYLKAKEELDASGPFQVTKQGYSTISGAMLAIDRLEKQLATIEGKFGFDLKSYGTLRITDADESDKDFD
jgi:phage terminase small subunit